MSDRQDLDWNDDGIDPTEDITEEDIEDAESMGKPEVGKYLCECVASVPRQRDVGVSCIAANIKLKIIDVLEIKKRTPTKEEKTLYLGRFLYDEISLPVDGEKPGTKKRRHLVALRFGLIQPGDTVVPKKAWSTDIIGKRIIVEYTDEPYTDREGNAKIIRKIPFSGYESAMGLASASGGSSVTTVNVSKDKKTSASQDTFEEI